MEIRERSSIVAIEQYDSVKVLGLRGTQRFGKRFGPSLVDIDEDVEERGGTYRELTIITIASPWKVRPSGNRAGKSRVWWWQR